MEELRQRREALEQAKALIRRNAALFYSRDCPDVLLPNDAFLSIELDGLESTRELAVTFGRARCSDGSASAFTGTGGVSVQFWQISGDRPSLILEGSVHGFHAQAPYLVTMKHGGACPGGAGPSPCRVIYRWDTLGRRLETESRQLLDDGWVLHDYGALTGSSPCPAGQRQRRGLCR